ncbi:MAG TPA: undecaprenyldiphospho-muramoylpentapeptide beta-N-acetylglucosaminyltransferase [Clostridiales bacterium]|nr:undecaprenyldiphospho-muramoylpentapeptide beta-N-acetylglucosaminyltransferase [Clostridiales bacterium]HPV01830.1 undecaprenyldiphospho-muramoylpentapeptide beta-N-acetylglucosaminyltransferase [Clostridiales bacterium]
MEEKVLVLTGGGTSGHVTPNIALLPYLKQEGYTIHYIGSRSGMEKELIMKEGIPYYGISAGKLRRYFDFRNFTDVFRVASGFLQAYSLLGKLKPAAVFSKGGFVSCPVVWAAWMRRIPVIIHESDITPGLTNRLSMPFAKAVCYTFPETARYIPEGKGIRTGMPIRQSLLKGDRRTGREICGFSDTKPVIMVIGGSLGSENINNAVRSILDRLLKDFNVCHICGKGNVKEEFNNLKGYRQFEYVNEEQPHLYALADLVVSRAGATVLHELLALKKPNLLIPLSRAASRGDQILNAASFEKQGYSKVLPEEELNCGSLTDAIYDLWNNADRYTASMKKSTHDIGVQSVIEVIRKHSDGRPE